MLSPAGNSPFIQELDSKFSGHPSMKEAGFRDVAEFWSGISLAERLVQSKASFHSKLSQKMPQTDQN
jgi:hypothetical protein